MARTYDSRGSFGQSGVSLNVDFGAMDEYLGIQEALVRVLNSPKTRNKWTRAMALQTGTAFNVYADAMASANPDTLHHVYEWGQVGNPMGRLWHMILHGNGANRVLDFTFVQSREYVPAGEAETGIAGDTRKRRHVFRWKAAVMELGTPVSISPMAGNSSGVLAIPMQEIKSGQSRGKSRRSNAKTGNMYLTKGPVTMRPDKRVQGAFTQAWVTFFSTRAMPIVNEEGVAPIENFFRNNIDRRLMRQLGKTPVMRKQGAGIHVNIKGPTALADTAEKSLNARINRMLDKAEADGFLFRAGG